MSTSAHERMRYLANWSARDIANSLFQKWAIKGFFTESPCRVLSLVLSFAPKESTTPLGAAAPPSAPESARQALGRGSRMAKLAFLVACRGLSARHLSPSVRSLKMESALWNDNTQPAPESARQSRRQGTDFGKVAVSCRLQGAFRSPPAPLWAAAADISHSNL